MFKATLKSVAVALSVLAAIILILTAVDGAQNMTASAKNTFVKVAVVDLDGNPVHNAEVTVEEQTFFTDNNGLSPSIELKTLSNSYDPSVAEWGTVTVTVVGKGYIPTFVFNCVVFRNQTRQLTVRIYPEDASELPYVTYVESPPNDYLQHLLQTER